MSLKLRPTGLGSGIDKDAGTMSSTAATWDVGRIYETPDSPDHLRWFWSMNVNGPMTRAGHMPTLEEAKGATSEKLGRLEGWKRSNRLARPALPTP
ncbi:MAG TPA: hypothetical protein VFP43_17160 [Mesorhizobium sp.]|nr:hypothetical protein [Mesorhizobium sp.]